MDESVDAIAAGQHGVLSRSQARATGMSCAAIRHRLEKRRWVEVTPRVYRIAGSPESPQSLVMATVLSAGPDGVATGTTALAMHGVRDFQLLPAHVVVCRRPHRLALDGVTETFRLPDSHRTVVDGIPSATVARALFELAKNLGTRRLARAVDSALAARLVRIPEIDAVLEDLAERGRHGSPKLREVLAERRAGYVAPMSALESRFLEILTENGVPAPDRQVGLGGALGWIGSVDFSWPDQRVVVETDGSEYHDSVTDRENDERRDRALERAGWTVLRFGWIDVAKRPTSVIRTVRRALALAS